MPTSRPPPRPALELAPSVREEDAELCARVARGEDAAFERLVERYQHRVYAFCLRMLQEPSEAEDVAQDVFLTLYRNATEFRGDAAFSTWLFRIAKNQTLNRLKYLERRGRYRRRPLDELADEGGAPVTADDPRPDERLEQAETSALVQEAIATLAGDHRLVLVLRDLEDLSYEEIAQVSGLPIGTVKSRIHRARSALARRLKRILR